MRSSSFSTGTGRRFGRGAPPRRRASRSAAFAEPVHHVTGDLGERLGLGHPRAQLAQGLAQLVERRLHVVVQAVEVLHPGRVGGHDPFELEADVGQPLAQSVVEVAGQTDPLLLGAEGAEAAEPAGVVDREREHLGQSDQHADVALVEVGELGVLQAQQADRDVRGSRGARRCRCRSARTSRSAGATLLQVAAQHGLVAPQRRGQRLGQHLGAVGRAQHAALGQLRDPLLGVLVEREQADDPGVEGVGDLALRGVQRLAQGERGRQRPGDAVDQRQQAVGLAERLDLAGERDAAPLGLEQPGAHRSRRSAPRAAWSARC